ncbi:MAG TPA: hypothetical protein VGM54_15625 [Chthoniobacter sp.]|jgi:hypothetical protein
MNPPFRSVIRAVTAAAVILLAPALTSLQAQEPTPKAQAVITPDFTQKMLQLITDKGTNREMPPSYAAALGFAEVPEQKWMYRGIIGAEDNEHQHSYNIGLKSSREVAIVIRDLKSIRANRIDPSGKVLAAIEIDLVTGDFVQRKPADAQHEVDAEIDLWNGKVDALLAAKKSK